MIDRRTLMTGVGAGLAISAIKTAAAGPTVKLPNIDAPSEKPKPAEPLPDAPDHRVGIAVVGIGHLTMEQLLPAFIQSKQTKLVALVSGDRDKARTVGKPFGIADAQLYDYARFDRIVDDPAIEAVYIVLPNHMHAEYTIRAAKAGKHVLCEKPMATTSADADKMIDACKQAKRKLMIAYRIQYEPHNRFVMKQIRDKRFGAIKLIEGHNGQNQGSPNQWRLKKGGGAMMDVGIYCLNTARFLLGEEPLWVQAAVYATPGDARFTEVDESVTWQMAFPSGAQCSFSTSFGTHRAQRYRCLGDKGGWIGADPAFAYDGLAIEMSEVRGGEELRSTPTIAAKQQFALELDHFATCIRADKQPYTPGEEGAQDMRLMEAIFESAKTGRRVDLPKVTKLDAFRGTPPDA